MKGETKGCGEKMYKKNITLKIGVIIIILLTSSCSVFAVEDNDSNTITMIYSFTTPVMQKISVDSNTYDQVDLDGAPCSGDPGLPSLPAYGASLLLPYGTKVERITVVPGAQNSLGTGFIVPPVGEPVPFSQYPPVSTPTSSEKNYTSTAIYPGELFTEVGTYSFRGYTILVLRLYPVQYIPYTGGLFYYTEFTVSVETSTDAHINSLFRGLATDAEGVRGKVDNPAVIDTYAEHTCSPSSETYDLLIVTTETLKAGFEPLKQVHNTIIKTLTEIGSNDPADIRDYIRDVYLNCSIEYVLIGGDDNIVPVRKLRVNNEDIPSDLYYACLDGSYNSDGDTMWGEPTDGDDGGDVDLIAEVYVGRACVGAVAEVDHFINKTLAYINKSDTSNHDVWLVGEHLGFGGVAEYAGNILEELINGSSAHGYTTVGIPNEPDKYLIYKLFDRPGYNWPKSEIIAIINDGVHIINHLGHGNIDYAMKMYNPDADALTNVQHCFIYSQTCLAGHFDLADCFAEHMNVKTEYGAFALVMNSREGWGYYESTDGPSQRYNREFWDAIFGENITVISKANQDSKEDNIYRINDDDQIMRWVFYELNLFGDPMVDLGNSPPEKPQKPVGAESGHVGENYLYTTTITDPDGNLVYCQWDWGDNNLSEWLGPYASGEEISIAHRWDKKGSYEVRVKAKDTYNAESNWSDPLSVTMPKNQGLFKSFFDIIEHYFPRLFSILDYITKGINA